MSNLMRLNYTEESQGRRPLHGLRIVNKNFRLQYHRIYFACITYCVLFVLGIYFNISVIFPLDLRPSTFSGYTVCLVWLRLSCSKLH